MENRVTPPENCKQQYALGMPKASLSEGRSKMTNNLANVFFFDKVSAKLKKIYVFMSFFFCFGHFNNLNPLWHSKKYFIQLFKRQTRSPAA